MAFDPNLIAAFGALIDKYGLPLAILVLLGVALVKRWIVMGSELDRTVAAYDKELLYREDRRLEERTSKLAMQDAVRELAGGMTKISDAIDKTQDVILDAIDGKPPRAR